MIDDRLPMVLVILDGLGDRASEALNGRTPCEAADTPVLDALVSKGIGGLHVPFGPGRCTSSEMAHWSIFGYEKIPFPGRAAIEALGVGQSPPAKTPMFHLALRHGQIRDDAMMLGARARPDQDAQDAKDLFDSILGRTVDNVRFDGLPLRTGECALIADGSPTRDVSDTDALFDHVHPWMRPRALSDAEPAAAEFAATLERWLHESHQILTDHPVNHARTRRGLPTLNVAVTKWASWIDPDMPSFEQRVGLKGGAVTDTALYRGIARILGFQERDLTFDPANPAIDMRHRIQLAEELLTSVEFVHVHVKSTDEAGHRKDPAFKQHIIEQTDQGLEQLLTLSERAIVAVTGDHATPSIGGLMHSGDPTPLLLAGPGIRADAVTRFGETDCGAGWADRLRARDILPMMCGLANRPWFLGHRPGPWDAIALPDAPEAMPLLGRKGNKDD